jgi:anti-sigma-K factor RskA
MPERGHIADRLAAWMAGDLTEQEVAEVREHLASCRACWEERDVMSEATSIVPPLGRVEPRPGFAVRVAALAAERRPRPIGAPWWRWAFGGGLAAAAAAVAVLVIAPATRKTPPDDVTLAQRLELFEDLNVVQNQDALKDLDVVAVLHTLEPEGKP